MHRTKIMLLALLPLSAAAMATESVPGTAKAPAPTSLTARASGPTAEFHDFLHAFRREQRIPSLSVAVVQNHRMIFAEGYGFQDHDNEEPTTAATTYLVASITKTFSGATLLGMAEDGLIDLNADFTELSDWADRCKWLGSSGSIFGGGILHNGTVIGPVDCEAHISIEHVLTHRVNGKPGADFVYNPIVFGRLSNLIEEQTGKSFRHFMYEYVITPGDLYDTAAGWRDPKKGHVLTQLAPPFRHAEGRRRFEPSVLPNTELNASSGIISSVVDLAKYAIALMEGRILKPALTEKLWSPPRKPSGEVEPYAFGWYVHQWEGHRLVFHTGWWPDAYTGLLIIAPDEGAALVALANTDGLHWEKPLDVAGIEGSPIAMRFLRSFIEPAQQSSVNR